MTGKLNKYSVPTDFTIGLTVLDFFPVLFFAIASVIMVFAFKNIIMMIGATICVLGGFLKISWKLIIALKRKNLWFMSFQLRFSLPLGFILLIIGLHQTKSSVVWTYVWEWIFDFPVCVFLYIGLTCVALLLLFAFTLDGSSKKVNYIEQITNIIAQFNFLLVVVCLAYFCDFYHAEHSTEVYQLKYNSISLENHESYIALTSEASENAFILYPGAKVEPKSYIPMLAGLVENGIDCYIARMPYNFAIFNISIASDIMSEYSGKYSAWYIGGHSLGGAMAANYAASNSDSLSGLILLAAYSTSDLTDSGLRLLSILGENDGVISLSTYNKCLSNLPDGYTEIKIPGGNHAMFGDYGSQSGDNPGTISATEAWSEIQAQILKFIKQ